MSEDHRSHVIPLAPVRINRDNEDSSTTITKPNSLLHRHHHKKSSKCLVYMLSTLVILSILMLIFGLTIRITSPEVRLNPIKIYNLRYGENTTAATAPPSLDMNMVAEISVENRNFGPFKFHNSTAAIFYENITIGVTNIHGGEINARDGKMKNVTVQVRSNELLNNNAKFSSDVGSRLVPVTSYMELKGDVRVVKIITSTRTAIMNCTMTLDLIRQAFRDLACN